MKKIFLILALCLLSMSIFAQNIEKLGENSYRITGDRYVAETTDYKGGMLQSFKVDGVEFEETEIPESRGNYVILNENGKMTFPRAEKSELNDNVITVTYPFAEVIYKFFPDRVEITGRNTKNGVLMGCAFILNPGINFVKTGNKYRKFPLEYDNDSCHVWIKDNVALETDGYVNYRGPYGGGQIIDFSPNYKLDKTLILKPVDMPKDDLTNVLSDPWQQDVNIYSPKYYQVFQRQTKDKGYIILSGAIKKDVSDVLYRLKGKNYKNKDVDSKWKKLEIDKNCNFNKIIEWPAGGWYSLEIKYKKDGKENLVSVDYVGIGEIIIGTGQSNSTNSGQYHTRQTSGYVVNTDGIHWRLANDPQIGVHDGSTGGSLYPSLGDALYKKFNVPIAVVPTGWGGTYVAQWLPDADPIPGSPIKTNFNLYDYFMFIARQFGPYGFRCVIWHQGESDVFQTEDYYYDMLSRIIFQSRIDASWNIPWFTARATYMPGTPNNGISEPIRAAQKKLWDNGVSFEGPDTDQWLGDYRDYEGTGVHFSPKGLKKHGEAWAEFIGEYIKSQIY